MRFRSTVIIEHNKKNLVLEVETSGQGGHMVIRSRQNDNKNFTEAASETFSRWLHHRYVSVELPLVRNVGLPHDTSLHKFGCDIMGDV